MITIKFKAEHKGNDLTSSLRSFVCVKGNGVQSSSQLTYLSVRRYEALCLFVPYEPPRPIRRLFGEAYIIYFLRNRQASLHIALC